MSRSRIEPFPSPSAPAAEIVPPSKVPFPLEALPPAARRMAEEVARSLNVSVNLTAPMTLGILSAALGKGAVSQSPRGQITRGNLFLLGIAGTGTGKSEAARPLIAPFLRLQTETVEAWKTHTKPRNDARKMEVSQRKEVIKRTLGKEQFSQDSEANRELVELNREEDQLDARAKSPQLIVEDATSEALAAAFGSWDESLFSCSTDAGKLISNLHGRYSPSASGRELREDSLLLKAFSVESYQINRSTKPSQTLEEPCLSLLWLIQPGKLPLLFGDEALCDGGLMPRVMPFRGPEGLPLEKTEPPPDPDAVRAWEELVKWLFELRKNGGSVKSAKRLVFPVSHEADRIRREWNNEYRKRTALGGDLADVSDFVSRWGEWAARIAVVLIAADRRSLLEDDGPDSPNPAWKCDCVSEDVMKRAIQITEWFIHEQLGILHQSRLAAREKKAVSVRDRADKLEKQLQLAGGEKSLADLYNRNGFAREEVESLVRAFPEKFEIAERESPTKPSTVCRLKA